MTSRVTDTAAASTASTPAEPTAAPRRPDRDQADDLVHLRSIIIGPRLDDIEELRARLDDPSAVARTIGPALPEAIARRGQDPRLARALAPSVELAITTSVRRNPQPLADALFPVMGPAIRNAIAHALGSMLESFNRTIEHSFSWRALRWRVEAMRTGRSFAEVVLLNTLEYRVEQVFLIHRETGLLLQHVASATAGAHDADMISAMLTAIRDFARDSFGASNETLDAFKIGDVSAIVVPGPHAILAGIARGLPPAELRTALTDALETIHLQFGDALAAFSGDSAPFTAARPILESCLLSRFRSRRRTRRVSWRWALAGGLVLALVAVWIGLTARDARRWQRYVERLRAEPGLVVVSEARRGRSFTVSGLRDPLAADPASFVAASGLPAERITGRWQPYQTLDTPFVLSRAGRALRPPAGVTLALADGVLTASGTAPADWAVESERLAPAIAGVRRFDSAVTRAWEQAYAQQMAALPLTFIRGTPDLTPGQEGRLQELTDLLLRAHALAAASGQHLQLRIVGHTDSDGTDERNDSLSIERAGAILARIKTLPLEGIETSAEGVGSSRPISTGPSERDKTLNRRVSLSLGFAGREAAARLP